MFENFSAESRAVIVQAQEEARQLNHDYIDTEHLLLALMKVGGPIVVNSLAKTSYEELRNRALYRFGRGDQQPEGHILFRLHANRTLEAAIRQAQTEQASAITPVHLLLGLSELPGSNAALLLLDMNISLRDVKKRLQRLLTQ